MSNNLDDEIVIGINKPKTPKKNTSKKKKKDTKEKKKDNKKDNKKVAKKATSKKNKKKDKQKKSKKGLIIFAIILVIILLIILLMNINICTIKNIELVDNNLVTKEQIEELANFDQYTNLFSLNITKVKEDIKKNAYIEDVKVSKKFPNTVKITLEERVPKYMLQVADSYIYINNQGYMLDISVEKLDLPIILGFKTDLSNVSAGSRLDVDDLKQMQTIIKIVETANINDIGSYITKIDVSNTKNYTLILEGEQKTVYLGDCSDLNTRMLYLSGILNQTKNLAGEIFLNMDLNTEDAYFREQT
jgi:cell division protein FtsQ